MEDHTYTYASRYVYLAWKKQGSVTVSTCKYTTGTRWPLYVIIHAGKGRGKGGEFRWLNPTYGSLTFNNIK